MEKWSAPWMDQENTSWNEAVDDWLSRVPGIQTPIEREPLRLMPWAAVYRIKAAAGCLYFKACASGGRHEPRLISLLSRRWPHITPTFLAVEHDRGWMLQQDHGHPIRTFLDPGERLALWESILPIYSEIQMETARDIKTWAATGVPNRDMSRLPNLMRSLLKEPRTASLIDDGLDRDEQARLKDSVSQLDEVCSVLASAPMATALDHGDLHDGNLFKSNGDVRLADWGDACLAHPFFSLVMLRHAIQTWPEYGNRGFQRLRDAYLEPWRPIYRGASLKPIFEKALWAAQAARVLNWDHMLKGAGPEAWNKWRSYLLAWLRRWSEKP